MTNESPMGERVVTETIDLVEVVERNLPIRGEAMLNVIKGTFRAAILSFTSEARRNKAPHPHRPDLRGSGVPRKRGKGKY